jgi:hypothetical protein
MRSDHHHFPILATITPPVRFTDPDAAAPAARGRPAVEAAQVASDAVVIGRGAMRSAV